MIVEILSSTEDTEEAQRINSLCLYAASDSWCLNTALFPSALLFPRYHIYHLKLKLNLPL